MKLQELPVIIVDCQTSGATPAAGQVVDLAWAVGVGSDFGAVESTCVALAEGAELTRAITRLTGLTTADLVSAPSLTVAAEQLTQAAASRVVVAHFAVFERRFLDPWLGDDARWICTHALARRLFPDLPRRGLRAVAGHLGLSLDEHKRAADHVAATARVWVALLARLAAQGVQDLSGLAALLDERPPPVKPARERVYGVPRAERLALPAVPGVYRMCDAEGRVLYVGKATDLKQRVNSYFRGRRGQGERKLELVTRASRLDVTPCASPFEAALLEVDEIQKHSPQYNVALRARGRALQWVDDALLGSPEAAVQHRWGPLSAGGLQQGLGGVWRGETTAWPWPEGPDAETVTAGVAAWAARPGDAGQMLRQAAARRVLAWCAALDAGAEVAVDQAAEADALEGPGAGLDGPGDAGAVVDETAGSAVAGGPAKGRGRRARPVAPPPEPWTPMRVTEALARWAEGTGAAIRRAHGLAHLLDADVVCLDPEAPVALAEAAEGSQPEPKRRGKPAATTATRWRRICYRAGQRVFSGAAEVEAPALPEASRTAVERQALMGDLQTFDRLAILCGGLRDRYRQGLPTTLHLPGQPPIEGDALGALLAVI